MEEMLAQWKNELIEAGLIQPGEEISQMDLMQRWQKYQSQKMKKQLSGIAKEIAPKKEAAPTPKKVESAKPKTDDLEELRKMVRENPELADKFSEAIANKILVMFERVSN